MGPYKMAVMLRILYIVIICFYFVKGSNSEENIREILFKNGPCLKFEFECHNKKCISREKWCNGIHDCDDKSDEYYCQNVKCPTHTPHLQCRTKYNAYYRCVPMAWKCDGYTDAPLGGEDENNCKPNSTELSFLLINTAGKNARNSILRMRKKERSTQKWGTDVSRIAIALYLSNPTSFVEGKNSTDELAYELSLNFLSRFALKKIEDVSTSEIALYVNAFLVTCIDPRKFYVVDLVDLLRKRVDAQNSTNAFAMLALCNAQDLITARDVENLRETFWKAHREFRTDTQALVILALSCASSQPLKIIDLEELSDMTTELKKRQYRNGTVENLKTTALVMQALFASEHEPDNDNFDEKKAIQQILRLQEGDGSFGSILNTYYALPVLRYSSLVNISSSHCPPIQAEGSEVLQYLKNQVGVKWSVKYSLWIGDDKLVQRTLTVSVPANTSLYGIIEYAADLDEKYQFECNVRDRKPYIYALSGLMDDPEMETFWFPYLLKKESEDGLKPLTKSPADIIPENNGHLVFWYKRGT